MNVGPDAVLVAGPRLIIASRKSIVGSNPTWPTKFIDIMTKIYIAMAEFVDGNRIFERAYTTREAAERACVTMINDIRENTDWDVAPIVEDLELVDE